MGNEGMSAGQLLKQANQLKRAGRLDEALAEPSSSYIALLIESIFVEQGVNHKCWPIVAEG